MTNSELIEAFPWLADVLADNPAYLDELQSERELSQLVGKSVATLQTERVRGGPSAIPFVKLGKLVKYRRRHGLELIARNIRTSTSDPGPEAASDAA